MCIGDWWAASLFIVRVLDDKLLNFIDLFIFPSRSVWCSCTAISKGAAIFRGIVNLESHHRTSLVIAYATPHLVEVLEHLDLEPRELDELRVHELSAKRLQVGKVSRSEVVLLHHRSEYLRQL